MKDSREAPIDSATVRTVAEASRQIQPILPQLQQTLSFVRENFPRSRQIEARWQEATEIARAADPLMKNLDALQKVMGNIQKVWPHIDWARVGTSQAAHLLKLREDQRRECRLLLEDFRLLRRETRGREAFVEGAGLKATSGRFEAVEARFDRLIEKLNKTEATLAGFQKSQRGDSDQAPAYVLDGATLRFLKSPQIRIVWRDKSEKVELGPKGYSVFLCVGTQTHRGARADGEKLVRLIKRPSQSKEAARHHLSTILVRIERKIADTLQKLGGPVVEPGEIIQSRSPDRGSRKGLHRYSISIHPKRIILPTAPRS